MIQRICVTLIVVVIYFFMSVQGIPKGVSLDVRSTDIGAHTTGRNPSNEEVTLANMLTGRNPANEILVPVSSPVAHYSEWERSWTFFAKVIQLKDVLIYGRPGTIAQVEYMRDGAPQYAWIVIKIGDYYFSEGTSLIVQGREIMLEISGEYVSSHGVNWDACPRSDKYCESASFIEGGFPISEDYNGLTICPSNALIYSGYAPDDWINGILAWRVKILD